MKKRKQSNESDERKITCPYCGSKKVREIIYGLISFKGKNAVEKFNKKCISGGCCVGPNDARYHCDDCEGGFGDSGEALKAIIKKYKELNKNIDK